jgi:ribosomal protein S27AE
MNVFPIQASSQEEVQAKCPNCGATVVADQRYCLTCGQPCSPMRLAFLDVLQAEGELRGQAVTIASPVAGYLPPLTREDGAIGWLRRYSGVFGLLAVLLTTGLIGLLVGHWLAPVKVAGPQVVKIEGGVLPSPAASAPAASSPAASPPSATTSSAATEAQEIKEVKEAESPKAKPKAPIKTSSSSLQKIAKSKGKKYQQEINKLVKGDQPIETAG